MRPTNFPAGSVPRIGAYVGVDEAVIDADDALLRILDIDRERFEADRRAGVPLAATTSYDLLHDALEHAVASGGPSTPVPATLRGADDTPVPVLVTFAPTSRTRDGAQEWLAVAVDLTPSAASRAGALLWEPGVGVPHEELLVRVVSELVRERSRLGTMLDGTNVMIWAVDTDVRFLGGNEAFQRAQSARTSRRMLPGDHLLQPAFRYDSRADWAAWYDRALAGELFQVVFEADTGEVLQVRFSPIRDADRSVVGTTAVLTDITTAHRATEELERSATVLRIAGQLAGIAGWVIDLPHRALTLSEGLHDVLQLDEAAPPTLEASLSWYPDAERPRVRAAVEACIEHGEAFDIEVHIALANGPEWIRVIGEPQRDGDGTIVAVHGAVVDLTDQKHAEMQLSDQASVLDNSTEAILVRDLDGRITYWNRAAEELYGWAPEEAIGRHIADLVDAGNLDKFHEMTEILWRQGEWSGRVQNTDRYGREFPIDLHVNVIRDDQGTPTKAFSIASDASDRVELEERVALADKLESIGQLTGGLAHDFNNLLTVIIGGTEMLAEAVADDADLASINKMVMAAAEQGSQLTGRLLAFARRQTLQPQVVDPAPVVDELVELLRRSLAESIEILVDRPVQDAPDQLWQATIDPNQLEAALMNIALNARDAMPDGGRMTFSLHNRSVDGSDEVLREGDYVEIAVSDTGAGMTPEVRDRAFDPFFTTKGAGRGNGLGLSMVYGFAKQSGGHAEIESEPGRGTTVRLMLPRADGPTHRYVTGSEPIEEPPRGHERILVVEDEPMVRQHAVSVLRELGYDVLEAPDGPAALAVLDRVGPVDLLFTDVVMPGGLNGVELAAEVVARHPGIPTLFTSGYTDTALDEVPESEVTMLAKPYRRAQLATAIRATLDAQ